MGRDDDFRCRWLKHPLRNFQRGSTWRSNYDPLTAPNRVVDDLQFLPRISVESIVNRNSGTIGILKGCCSDCIYIRGLFRRIFWNQLSNGSNRGCASLGLKPSQRFIWESSWA